jgi:hypothetical protein
MTREEKFEQLKQEMIHCFEAYIEYLRTINCDDLNDFSTRMPLLQHYINCVKTGTSLREFVLDHHINKRSCAKEFETEAQPD